MFQVQKRVRFAHCDAAGIVFYPQYLLLEHEVFEDLFRDGLDYPIERSIEGDRKGLPAVKIEMEFKAPSRCGEVLDFTVTTLKLGRSSLSLEYEARCGGELRVRIKKVVVRTDLKTGLSEPFPDDLRVRIERLAAS